MKVVVVGAGLVGTTLAIALKQRGYDVALYEKRSDPRDQQVGGGRSINLIVTAKGIKTFKSLNLWESVKSITTPVYGRMMHDQAGKLTYQPYGRDDSEYNHSISRGELNNLLLDEVDKHEIPIYFEYGLEKIEAKTAIFDKESIAFDKIFGTDGAGSKVREAMIELLGNKAQFKVTPLGVDYKEFTMPANQGEFAIDPKALHIWPRGEHFLMALPNQDKSFTMTLYMPTDWFEKYKNNIEEYFEEFYPDSLDHMPNFEKEYRKNPQGFLGTVSMFPWIYQDSVMLLGDAAHAIVPFFGQGMNCGLSDIQFLIDQLDQNEGDWSVAFKNYQEHQKPNGDAIAQLSLENYKEMSDHVGDQSFLLRKKVELELEKRFPTKYRSRYGMTVYTLIPYHQVIAAGEIQDELLNELMRDVTEIDQVDFSKAEKLIDGLLVPWFTQRNLSIEKYRY